MYPFQENVKTKGAPNFVESTKCAINTMIDCLGTPSVVRKVVYDNK